MYSYTVHIKDRERHSAASKFEPTIRTGFDPDIASWHSFY